MNRYLKVMAALAVGLALVGCEQKSSVKKEVTVKGPEGTTTTTQETTVEKSGKSPPAANPVQPVMPNEVK